MSALSTVLIVDDELMVRQALEQCLKLAGFDVTSVSSASDAEGHLRKSAPHVVLTDVCMPNSSGLELLAKINRLDPAMSVIVITGHGDVPMAVQAMQSGAFDFIQKPYNPEELIAILDKAACRTKLRREVSRHTKNSDDRGSELSSLLLGMSDAMVRTRALVSKIAPLEADVIIHGETGAGKEVVAQCLHQFSKRAAGPFVAVNCAAIPADLIESELFGHEAGAFTGSNGVRVGKFEYANRGTLLLDEIESMPLLAQAKVLRVIQERSVTRLGSNKAIPLDLRILAATKVDLAAEAEVGRFRADLFYRLNVATLKIPPLRDRGEDSLLLFSCFLEEASVRYGTEAPVLRPADIEQILSYQWPGNVRELKTAADRFVLGLDREMAPSDASDGIGGPVTLAEQVANFEKRVIERELRNESNSIARVSEKLQVPRRTLHEKMARLNVERA